MRDCVVAGAVRGWNVIAFGSLSRGCFTRRFAAVPTQLPQGISRP
jgi:hypothetical protein